jgi:hypothetical protein
MLRYCFLQPAPALIDRAHRKIRRLDAAKAAIWFISIRIIRRLLSLKVDPRALFTSSMTKTSSASAAPPREQFPASPPGARQVWNKT